MEYSMNHGIAIQLFVFGYLWLKVGLIFSISWRWTMENVRFTGLVAFPFDRLNCGMDWGGWSMSDGFQARREPFGQHTCMLPILIMRSYKYKGTCTIIYTYSHPHPHDHDHYVVNVGSKIVKPPLIFFLGEGSLRNCKFQVPTLPTNQKDKSKPFNHN